MEQQLSFVGADFLPGEFVTHVVARATFLPGTERCTGDDPFRYAFGDEVLTFLTPSTSPLLAVQCFADVRVNSYILGKGSPRLTVQTGLWVYTTEYLARMLEYGTESEEEEEKISAEGLVERMRANLEEFITHGEPVFHYETGSGPPTSVTLTGGISGQEVVLFLGPSINQDTEVWQVFETWAVQRKNDGTAAAIHPHREAWRMSKNYSTSLHDPLLEVELPRFRQEVAEASKARLERFDGRIGEDETLPMFIFDTNDLREYMISTGAYVQEGGPPLPPPATK